MRRKAVIPFIGTRPLVAHEGDAGSDLRAHLEHNLTIQPGESAMVPLDLRLAIPEGCVGLMFPRSGLGTRHGICLANGTGVIDSAYRGELMACLLNLGRDPFTVHVGDRVCQLVIVPYVVPEWTNSGTLPYPEREVEGPDYAGARW